MSDGICVDLKSALEALQKAIAIHKTIGFSEETYDAGDAVENLMHHAAAILTFHVGTKEEES